MCPFTHFNTSYSYPADWMGSLRPWAYYCHKDFFLYKNARHSWELKPPHPTPPKKQYCILGGKGCTDIFSPADTPRTAGWQTCSNRIKRCISCSCRETVSSGCYLYPRLSLPNQETARSYKVKEYSCTSTPHNQSNWDSARHHYAAWKTMLSFVATCGFANWQCIPVFLWHTHAMHTPVQPSQKGAFIDSNIHPAVNKLPGRTCIIRANSTRFRFSNHTELRSYSGKSKVKVPTCQSNHLR